ncbi:MAG: hypothetical protein ACRECV_21340 [Xanthobacteraceae bacterium]
MTEHGRAREQNLTGIWNGLYTYPDGKSMSFVATLIEAGASISGTTHEPGSLGGGAGATLYASLNGSRSGSSVTFTKAYDQPDRSHRSPILYEGALNGDGTEIEGRWTIVKAWSGKFLMIRSPGEELKASRDVVERVR